MSKSRKCRKGKVKQLMMIYLEMRKQPQTGTEQVIRANRITDLHEFRRITRSSVLDDEKMEETTESIRKHGVLDAGHCQTEGRGRL